MLQLSNLSKKRGALFRSLHLTVHPGEIAVLLGPSGVGKSTLLRILNGLESMDEGTILFDNERIDPRKRSDIIGMVFQDSHLFEHMTVSENIALPLRSRRLLAESDIRRQVDELLEMFGLAAKGPLRASQLSGGQKQRLAIARSLALKPRILCMDEPTSALDPWNRNEVFDMMRALARGGTALLVATHDPLIAEKVPCTLHLLKTGAIEESASSENFLASRKDYPLIHSFLEGSSLHR